MTPQVLSFCTYTALFFDHVTTAMRSSKPTRKRFTNGVCSSCLSTKSLQLRYQQLSFYTTEESQNRDRLGEHEGN